MSTQPLRQAMDAARASIASVQADQLGGATPCASWNVGQLINHVVNAQGFFASTLTGEAPAEETDWAAQGDYLAAFDEKAAACCAAFEADGAMEKMLELPFATMPGAAWMGLAVNDTFTHAWDIAKATGQSTDINPELAAGILAQARQSIQESFRGDEGAPFGAEQQAPEGASQADQLAAFLGRQV